MRLTDGDGSLFGDGVWQMSFGERAAIEGILAALRPDLAIEVGTAEGASLRRIASHAAEVHSFDLDPPTLDLRADNVVLHTGDSHVLLPRLLETFSAAGRRVDFALVDGDHSASGVRQDVLALLESPCVAEAVIVTHDTGNEEVRRGLDSIDYDAFERVSHVDLDFVPGHLGSGRFPGELWYGLGLIIVGGERVDGYALQRDRHHGGELLALARDALKAGARHDERVLELEDALTAERALLAGVLQSRAWRVTGPLREARDRARALRRRISGPPRPGSG